MADKAKKTAEAVLQRWKSLSRKVKTLIGCGALAILAAVVIVAVVLNNQPYATLFTGLSQTDLSAISTYFSENGITDYKVEDNTILVPQAQEASLKAQVLVAGYPSSGYGYDTYLDNVGSLTTESERNQLTLYGLQDRLAAVIRNFEGVKDAVVFLTPGEDHTYVLDSSNVVDATAAVQVTMQDGKMLDEKQVGAIRNLVSRCLAGLNVENVDISDTYGNTYSSTGNITDLRDASALKLSLEEQCNNNIRTRVMQALIPLYGADNVQVSVNTVVDVDRTYTDSTDYSLEDWAQGKDDGIIGSQIWDDEIVRDDGTNTGGVAGTTTNADVNTYVEDQIQPDGTESMYSSSGQTDRLVDTTKEQVEHVAGYISDVMVSVTINSNVAGGANVQDLYDHVARAAGISKTDQADKISILVSPFYQDSTPVIATPEGMEPWMFYAVLIGGGVLLLFLLILVLVLRHRAKKERQLEQEPVAAAVPEQETPEQPDILEMQTEKSMELRKDVRQFAQDNPEIAAQMVKNWLREGDHTT
ncbi:flagellar M-ring protein FliF C-terminal domain-containing protein [Candidatus Allofournierella merdavium]|uniref:flagellar M-ring protein FliF C-terminal domain-containing protein n=1 Tax=Candidatus Allofournierella merdavium TaxID=2838593 RepID=UPI00374EA252